jgi:hypothetical protein
MRRKAHTTLTALLVLHRTRIDKWATKKFIINGQWRSKLFFIVIHRFSLAFVNCAKTFLPTLAVRYDVKKAPISSFSKKYIPSAQQIFTAPI